MKNITINEKEAKDLKQGAGSLWDGLKRGKRKEE